MISSQTAEYSCLAAKEYERDSDYVFVSVLIFFFISTSQSGYSGSDELFTTEMAIKFQQEYVIFTSALLNNSLCLFYS